MKTTIEKMEGSKLIAYETVRSPFLCLFISSTSSSRKSSTKVNHSKKITEEDNSSKLLQANLLMKARTMTQIKD